MFIITGRRIEAPFEESLVSFCLLLLADPGVATFSLFVSKGFFVRGVHISSELFSSTANRVFGSNVIWREKVGARPLRDLRLLFSHEPHIKASERFVLTARRASTRFEN